MTENAKTDVSALLAQESFVPIFDAGSGRSAARRARRRRVIVPIFLAQVPLNLDDWHKVLPLILLGETHFCANVPIFFLLYAGERKREIYICIWGRDARAPRVCARALFYKAIFQFCKHQPHRRSKA